MKILANPELLLNQHQVIQTLPHLAIELEDIKNTDKLNSNDTLIFKTPLINFEAVVYKPGGTRFILKSFRVYSEALPPRQNIIYRLLKLFRLDAYVRSQGMLLIDITNFLNEVNVDLIQYANIERRIE